ncbi:unnamed protein product [Paramecium sonneborni]|uniref:Uncharacterized protein n=1 Tax=Paramecium sonneborni TaxID=65129 RepID=A0A8S1LI49_9CILI|nr:unnamed protein product [Paramecium sonneborni]
MSFLLAYQNLLKSHTNSDFKQFILENCDKNISKGLIEGMQYLKVNGYKLKLILMIKIRPCFVWKYYIKFFLSLRQRFLGLKTSEWYIFGQIIIH